MLAPKWWGYDVIYSCLVSRWGYDTGGMVFFVSLSICTHMLFYRYVTYWICGGILLEILDINVNLKTKFRELSFTLFLRLVGTYLR